MIATVTCNPSLDEWVTLPQFKLGELNRAISFQRDPGGKGINVSRVVHELGGSTIAVALAGGDDGDILRKLMRSLRIPHEFVEVSGSTRNNYKIVTQHPQKITEINTPGPIVTTRQLRKLERLLLNLSPKPHCVTLSGSLPPGAPTTIYKKWIRALKKIGIPTVLDASGEVLRQGMTEHPWLIKPNRQEAEEFMGRRLFRFTDLVKAVENMSVRGSCNVVLSLGCDGALLALNTSEQSSVWIARPPRIKVKSAVGSGDSLIGGLLVSWVQGKSLVNAFRLGVACGTATALTPGTELCHRRDVMRLFKRVTVKRLR